MASNNLTIRDAVESDADSILQVHASSVRQLCSAHYSEEQISGWVERQSKERFVQLIARNDDFVVAEDGSGQVIGFGHLGPCTDREQFTSDVNFEVPRKGGRGWLGTCGAASDKELVGG